VPASQMIVSGYRGGLYGVVMAPRRTGRGWARDLMRRGEPTEGANERLAVLGVKLASSSASTSRASTALRRTNLAPNRPRSELPGPELSPQSAVPQ